MSRVPWVTRVPWMTGSVMAVALIVSSFTGLGEWLQFEPAAHGSGEWWRGVTSHFTHCSPDHLAWNLFAFGALGAACEHRDRRGLLWVLALCTVAVPLTLWLLQPDLPSYRGLSGLASGCFTYLAARIAREALAREERWRAVAAVGLLGLFAAKTMFELVRGESVFVDGMTAGFIPVPLAHGVAGAMGLVASWLEGRGLLPGSVEPSIHRRCHTAGHSPVTLPSAQAVECLQRRALQQEEKD